LEHLEITENIPRDAVVFVKLDGDQKFKSMERAMGEEEGKKGQALISVTVKKMGPVQSRIQGLALEQAA